MSSLETRIIISARDMATSTMRRVEMSLEGVRSRALAVGGVMATGLGLAYVAKESLSAADKIGKVADKVGFTTDQLQELRYAAELNNVAQAQLDMGMQRFSRRLGEVAQGTGELLAVSKQYGVQLRDGNGQMRSNIDLLGDFSNVIQNAESDQEALRIAFKLFDSEGAALVNMLRGGSGALNQMREDAHSLGLVLDEQLIRNSEKANDELTRLERVLRTQLVGTVAEFSPEIAALSVEMLNWVRANRELIDQKTHQAVDAIKTSVSSLVDVYQALPDEVVGAAGYGLIGVMALGGVPGRTIALLKFAHDLGESLGNMALGLSDEDMAKIEALKQGSYLDRLIDSLSDSDKGLAITLPPAPEVKALSGVVSDVQAMWDKAHPQATAAPTSTASSGTGGATRAPAKATKSNYILAGSDEHLAYLLKSYEKIWDDRQQGEAQVDEAILEKEREWMAQRSTLYEETMLALHGYEEAFTQTQAEQVMARVERETQAAEIAKDSWAEIGQVAVDTGYQMGNVWVEYRKTGEFNLNSLKDYFLDSMTRMASNNVMDELMGSFSSGGSSGGGFLGSITALFNAKGNVFDASGVVPFAQGGILDSPTLFRYGPGGRNVGVGGEAGEEGLFPIVRNSRGDLSINGVGMGGLTQHLHFDFRGADGSVVGQLRTMANQIATLAAQKSLVALKDSQRRGRRN